MRNTVRISLVALLATTLVGVGVAQTPSDNGKAIKADVKSDSTKKEDPKKITLEDLKSEDAPPKRDIATLDAAMKDVFADLAALDHGRSAEAITKAEDLAQDWYAAGLKIVKPPAEGVTELPLPMKVRAKGDAVAAALEQVVEQAVAEAPPRSLRSVKPQKRRAATRRHPASTEATFEVGSPIVSVE